MRMHVPRFLKTLSYLPPIRRAVKALPPLARVLSRLYYGLARPANGILRLEVDGLSSQFYVPTPGELRFLESFDGEVHLLKMLIRTLKPGDCFYDIGASLGLYSSLLAKVVGEQGQVIAFEPEEYSYERLQEHVKLNSFTNIRTYRLALGDQSDRGKLYLPNNRGCFAVSQLHENAIGQAAEIVAGDLFVRAEKLPLPRAVKIDVEGHEHAVLRGLCQTLAQPACELVCCEIHPKLLPEEVKPEAVLALLKSFGFDRIDLSPRASEYHAVAYKRDAAGRQR